MQAFRFLASLQGLARSSTAGDKESTSSPAVASGKGSSGPDPAVRLRISEDKVIKIFSFPQQELPEATVLPLETFGNIGPPLLYLRGTVPAYVQYVMGSDWRKDLRNDYLRQDRHEDCNEQVMMRPTASSDGATVDSQDLCAEEHAHCVRMLRCGAIAVRTESDVASSGNSWLARPTQTVIWMAFDRRRLDSAISQVR